MSVRNSLSTLYAKCYQKCSPGLKSILSKSVFTLTDKPSVNHSNHPIGKKFPGEYKGALVITADFELGWGWCYSKGNENPSGMAQRARKNFPVLMNMFEAYRMPVTWATVGHLFLRTCTKRSHTWMHRIPYFESKNLKYDRGDWFDVDPYTDWDRAREWYGPDLIETILNSRIAHEIGCHTFSHIDFSYTKCPPEVAEDEMKACIDAAKKWGIALKSFVFPAGTYGHFEMLKKYGFTNYRMKLNYDLTYPFVDQHGLIVLPSSSSLENNGLGWSADYCIKRYKKYIDKAIQNEVLCHFWFHPSVDEWFLNNVFPHIVRYAAELRDKNLLCIETAGTVAEFVTSAQRGI